MEGFSFVTPVTGLNRPITGKKDDDDETLLKTSAILYAHTRPVLPIRHYRHCV
jgi:hypothetical protein